MPTGDPRVLRDMTNVLVHLAPAPVVARVPLTFTLVRGAEWFAQEVELAGFLAARGAPVAPPAAEVDPGPGELPACDRADEVADLLGRLEPSPLASAEELAALRDACGRVSPLPHGRPLHGDAHLRNVLWTREGPLWSDLENACSGPVEFDLASLLWRGMPGSDEALAAYGDHDPALVEATEPPLTLCLAAWTLVVATRVCTDTATAEARRRVERALAYAREM